MRWIVEDLHNTGAGATSPPYFSSLQMSKSWKFTTTLWLIQCNWMEYLQLALSINIWWIHPIQLHWSIPSLLWELLSHFRWKSPHLNLSLPFCTLMITCLWEHFRIHISFLFGYNLPFFDQVCRAYVKFVKTIALEHTWHYYQRVQGTLTCLNIVL